MRLERSRGATPVNRRGRGTRRGVLPRCGAIRLGESAVPNLQDSLGERKVQSEVPGVVSVGYTVDYQNPDALDEVSVTVDVEVGGTVHKQTISGWDAAFESMGNLDSAIADAYRDGLQDLLIDFSTLIAGDTDYDGEGAEGESDGEPPQRRLSVDHEALKGQLEGVVGNLDTYVSDAIAKEVDALGFVPTSEQSEG